MCRTGLDQANVPLEWIENDSPFLSKVERRRRPCGQRRSGANMSTAEGTIYKLTTDMILVVSGTNSLGKG